MPELTTWQGKDIEKMSREELLDVVREMRELLQKSYEALTKQQSVTVPAPISKSDHYTGLP